MMVSNDFTIRMLGILMPQIPENKSDINDIELNNILRKIGSYQVFIDISRCSSITSLPCRSFSICTNLLYLDLSYTKLNDISTICEYCTSLKGINISAINMIEQNIYNKLRNLEYLQILQMRYSNVHELNFIPYLYQLRSLDLGSTTIQCIEPLNTCSRLEELLLDNITLVNNDYTIIIKTFQHLKSLSLLNICESDLFNLTTDIQYNLPKEIHFEIITKRQQFYEYIIQNNYIEMNYILSSGIDIDIPIQIQDEGMLLKIWRNRCTTNKIKGAFFQCSNIEERYRPTALHLSIVFNAIECMQILLHHNASRTRNVWFSDIKESRDEPGIIIENNNSTQDKKIFNARELIDIVYKRNIHRLTDDMIANKIPNWKRITTSYYKRLVYLYDNKKNNNELLSLETIDYDIKRIEDLLQLQKVNLNDDDVDENIGVDDYDDLVTLDTISLDPTTMNNNISSIDDNILVNNKSITNTKTTNTTQKNKIISDINTIRISNIKVNSDNLILTESDNILNNTNNQQNNNIKNNKKLLKNNQIIPRINRIINWRKHSLVHKIIDSPRILNISIDKINYNNTNNNTSSDIDNINNVDNKINNLNSTTLENYICERRRSSIQIPKSKSFNIINAQKQSISNNNIINTTTNINNNNTNISINEQYSKQQLRRSSIGSLNTYDTNDSNNDNTNWIGDDTVKMKELKEVPLLGKKSYWLERRSQLIKEREEDVATIDNTNLISIHNNQVFTMNNQQQSLIKNNYYNSLSLKIISTTPPSIKNEYSLTDNIQDTIVSMDTRDNSIPKGDYRMGMIVPITIRKKTMLERKEKFLKDLEKRLDSLPD